MLVELHDPGHAYTIDGRPSFGVTSVIAEAGLADFRWVKEYYRDRGSRAHRAMHFAIEADLNLGNCPDDIVGYVLSASEFLDAHNAETVDVERRVASLAYGYAGTLDWLGYLDSCGKVACCPMPFRHALTLQDWKTSLAFHPATAIQTIAYADAWYEETKRLVQRRTCVLVAEDGGTAQQKEYAAANHREDRETWRAALKCCAWRRRHHIASLYLDELATA